MADADFMNRVLQLAQKAKGKTFPNPLVGAVIVKGRKIVGEGYHRKCGGHHAEVLALRQAGSLARGAVLYVNLEPCSHFGRTPPCVDAIIKSGIRKVIIGTKDPNPVNNGKSIKQLRRKGVETHCGVLQEECRTVNEVFFKYITKGMPFVVAKSAQTLDGKIATPTGQSKWITSKAARDYAHRLRGEFDAILVGINTVLKDNPMLDSVPKSQKLKKIIVDSFLKVPLNAKLIRKTKTENIIIATTAKADKAKLKKLTNQGIEVLVCPQKQRRVDLKWLFKQLGKKEITSVLIEGGANVIGGALKEDLVDKMIIFMAPKIMGNNKALNSIEGLKAVDINRLRVLKNLTVREIKNDFLIEGYLK